MINRNVWPAFDDAYQEILNDISVYGDETNPRNRASKELLGYSFIVDNPRDRLIGFKARNINPYYLVGNLLWVLKQSNKLEFINYYNPKGSSFSDDGETLPAAYGKRIFDIDGMNQWNECERELKLNPESRRAIINIHMAQYDWRGVLDTSCTSNFHFFIRNNKLSMINNMRSQSAAFVMPYDVFLMTMLQELMASELGVELGYYHHNADSMHYFLDEEEKVGELIHSLDYSDEMPNMPKNSMKQVKELLKFEELMRNQAKEAKRQNREIDIDKALITLDQLNIDRYWNYFGEVLIAKALDYNGEKNYFYEVISKSNPFKIYF
jgi:thymidylate synthase